MLGNLVLEQRRATKRLFIKRIKRGADTQYLQKKLLELSTEFPYNSEYYVALSKNLNKLNKIIKSNSN